MSDTSSTDGFCLVSVNDQGDTAEAQTLSPSDLTEEKIEKKVDGQVDEKADEKVEEKAEENVADKVEPEPNVKSTRQDNPDDCPEDVDDPVLPPIQNAKDLITDAVRKTVQCIQETNAGIADPALHVSAKEHMILFATFFEHVVHLAAHLPQWRREDTVDMLFKTIREAVCVHMVQADNLDWKAQLQYPQGEDAEKNQRQLARQHADVSKGLVDLRANLCQNTFALFEMKLHLWDEVDDRADFFLPPQWSTHMRHTLALALAAHITGSHPDLDDTASDLYLDAARAAVDSVLEVDNRKGSIVASLIDEGLLEADMKPMDETLAWYRQYLAHSFAGYTKWVVADVVGADQKAEVASVPRRTPWATTGSPCACDCHLELDTCARKNNPCSHFCPGCRPNNQWVLSKYCRTAPQMAIQPVPEPEPEQETSPSMIADKLAREFDKLYEKSSAEVGEWVARAADAVARQRAAQGQQDNKDKHGENDKDSEQIEAVLAEYAAYEENMASEFYE